MPVASRPSDDSLVAEPLQYIVACQPVHERLRGLLTQLAGLSLMTMLGREATFDRETPLRLVRASLSEAEEMLGGLPVPPRAAHHHHHVSAACRAISRACDMVSCDPITRNTEPAKRELSRQLRSAADHLRFASGALPGFEMVDLTQSCCAAHAATTLQAENATELKF